MCENLCGHSFIYCLLLFFMFSSFLPNAEARDPGRIHATTTMVLVVLSIMFTIILVLIAYRKFCRTSSFELMNPSVHPQNLARPEHSCRFYGIDKQVIKALPVLEFSSLKGSKEGLECVVCLSRFENHETLKLLPKCKHAFHMNCIDMWLEGHSTCPLCRCRVDPEDIKSFTSSISSRFLRVPSNLTEEPTLEIFVLRDQSRQGSLRINSERGLWSVEEGKKEEELVIDNGRNREILHKFNHRIVISGFVTRSRWSDLTATDLLLLNSEMLSVMSSGRFLASEFANGESSRRISNLSSASNEEQNSYKPLNWGGKRSMSDITIVPRLKEINRMKKLTASGDNNGSEERSWRIWWPIARRTVLGFARQEKS